MRLTRVHVRRAPGFPDGFRLSELAPGVNLIVGPNASGKTTFCRAVRASLWREEGFDGGSVEVEWRCGTRTLVADRVGRRPPSWSDASGEADAPRRPDAHLRRCFGLELEDLLSGGDETEGAIARNLRLELSDGQDTSLVLRDARDLTFKSAESARNAYDQARKRLAEVESAQRDLAEDEQRLVELKGELELSRAARDELAAYEAALALAHAREELHELERRRAGFPTGMDRLPPDATKLAAERASQVADEAAALRESVDELGELQRKLAALDLDAEEVARLAVVPLEDRRVELGTLAQKREQAAQALAASERELGPGPDVRAPRAFAADELDLLEGRLEREQALASQLAELRARLAASEAVEEISVDARSPVFGIALVAAGVLALVGLALADAPQFTLRVTIVVPALVATAFGVRLAWRAFPAWSRRENSARRRAELERTREECARVEERLASAQRERGAELHVPGLGAEHGALSSIVLARRLALVEAAARRIEGERLALEDLDARIAAEVRRAVELAHDHRRPEPRDAAEARALFAALERDRVASAELLERVPRQQARVERARAGLARLERSRAELYLALGLEPGDDGGLQERANLRGEWLDLRARRDALRQYVSEHERRLESRAHLAELGREELEANIAERRALSAEVDRLQEEVSKIVASCDVAQQHRALERARADLEQARGVLEQKRDELVFGVLAEHVMTDIAASHRREAQPALVRRAGEHLARFTAARYALEVLPDGDASALPLRVREDGTVLDIRSLSSGTRVQLRIALRIAVAEAAEDGEEPLPIFFDEALAISDGERFDAIAGALGALARAGRQLFYLTADDDEARRFAAALLAAGCEAPRELRIGTAARRAVRASDLPPRARESLPEIHGHDAESYLRALEVPRLDPRQPVAAAHLAWVLADDLDALRRMLSEGVGTVGRAREVLARGWTSVWSEAERARFAACAHALETFLAAWIVGRPRKLDEIVLSESPLARSDKLDGVLELARELDGNAGALVDELRAKGADRDERVRRLPSRFVDAAVEEWSERGYYDPRIALDRTSCLDEAAGALEGELRAGTTTLGALERLVDRWWRALES